MCHARQNVQGTKRLNSRRSLPLRKWGSMTRKAKISYFLSIREDSTELEWLTESSQLNGPSSVDKWLFFVRLFNNHLY